MLLSEVQSSKEMSHFSVKKLFARIKLPLTMLRPKLTKNCRIYLENKICRYYAKR